MFEHELFMKFNIRTEYIWYFLVFHWFFIFWDKNVDATFFTWLVLAIVILELKSNRFLSPFFGFYNSNTANLHIDSRLRIQTSNTLISFE